MDDLDTVERSPRDQALDVLIALQRRKPHSLKRYAGSNQDPATVARWHDLMRQWNREYRAAKRAFDALNVG